MSESYEQTLDKNFDKALMLCSTCHKYEDLIEYLKCGNLPEKQYAALELSELKNASDAEIFISNLTGCDGKIREAVAQKFLEFVPEKKYQEYFSNYPEIFAKSTIDINANISRMIIDGLVYMSRFEQFGRKYADALLGYIYEAFDGLDKIVFRDKKYTINKQLFKLYWCLEGLNNYSTYLKEEELKSILERTLKEAEYTVREKAAQIIVNQTSSVFDDLKNQIKNDENYYIKRIIKPYTP